MGVTKALQILPIEVGIGQVLEQSFQLSEVNSADNLIDICVHNEAPIDTALSGLKIEFWRQGHQVSKDKVIPGLAN